QVEVGGTKFKCYLLALRLFCRMFRDNSFSPGDCIKFSDDLISPDCFAVAYAWMTQDEIYCKSDMILDLLQAAKFLICPELSRSIYDCLNDHNNYSELEAFDCYGLAMKRGMTQVAELMLLRVGKCFLILVGTLDFLELSVDHCRLLLGSNYLAVQSEIETFYAALIWIYYNYKERKQYIGRVLESVRFTWLPPLFLLFWSDYLRDLDLDLADQLCAYLDAAMALQQCEVLTPSIGHDESVGSRVWIRDPRCRYLKHLKLGYPNSISVEIFVEYIRSIQAEPNKFRARLE
ncbi:hypothetical protein KR067_008869, partial [Drosophila pandora]